MSAQSKIEWTDATWNPVRGCTQISPGCKNCYAKTFAERWRGVPGHAFEQGFDVRIVPEKLAEPLRWIQPRLIFVNSMSDLFHPLVPDDFIAQVGRVMSAADWHVYQVLTKRPERMRPALNGFLRDSAIAQHIWWGVSVENRKHGLPRVELLRASAAKVKFLSVEPLLEDLGEVELAGIDWVIVGGESGPGARPIRREWIVRLRDQCAEAGVPFFFKQWGGTRKHLTGNVLDGAVHLSFPPVVRQQVPEAGTRRQRLDELGLTAA
jgi:protein gp37